MSVYMYILKKAFLDVDDLGVVQVSCHRIFGFVAKH